MASTATVRFGFFRNLITLLLFSFAKVVKKEFITNNLNLLL